MYLFLDKTIWQHVNSVKYKQLMRTYAKIAITKK